MAKDLIIGGASGYNWKKLQYWVNSIQKTGFDGDIVLVMTNTDSETIDKLTSKNVKVYAYGQADGKGGFFNPNNRAPHVERFFIMWDFLKNTKDQYRFVTITDTRDVVFQTNPTEWLEKQLLVKSIVCSSEGLLYKNETWNDTNLLEAFGPHFHAIFREKMIYNVGTIAGFSDEITDFILMLFHLSINRPIPIVDQAVFNVMINIHPYEEEILKTNNTHEWAIQLGVTENAVKSGAGDIGALIKSDPSKLDEYYANYQDKQPTIKGHQVFNPSGNKYCIVHQWDRIPGLKEEVEKFYGDSECSEILTILT